MSCLVFLLAAWVFFGLELGLKGGLELGRAGVAPSFVIVLLAFIGASAPRMTVYWACLALGIVMDLTHARPTPSGESAVVLIGPYALGFVIAGYAVLTVRTLVIRQNLLTLAFLSVVAALMAGVIVIAIAAVRSWYDPLIGIDAGGELLERMGSAVYTGFVALVLGPLLMWMKPVFGFPQANRRTGWARG